MNLAGVFPQSSLPNLNIKQLSESVGKKLYERGIFGYITVDMISFPDLAQKSHPLFWMIGIDCSLNDISASFFVFDFLSKGKLDRVTGHYYLQSSNTSNLLNDSESQIHADEFEERGYIYAPFLQHEGLCKMSYRDFFQQCRKNQISYDLEKRTGYVYILSSALQNGITSLMTISETTRKAVKATTEVINFLLDLAGNIAKYTDPNQNYRCDNFYFADFVQKIRNLNKDLEK